MFEALRLYHRSLRERNAILKRAGVIKNWMPLKKSHIQCFPSFSDKIEISPNPLFLPDQVLLQAFRWCGRGRLQIPTRPKS